MGFPSWTGTFVKYNPNKNQWRIFNGRNTVFVKRNVIFSEPNLIYKNKSTDQHFDSMKIFDQFIDEINTPDQPVKMVNDKSMEIDKKRGLKPKKFKNTIKTKFQTRLQF